MGALQVFAAGEEIFLAQIGLQIRIPGAKICLKLPWTKISHVFFEYGHFKSHFIASAHPLAAILSLYGRCDIYGTKHHLFIYSPNSIFMDVLMLGSNSDTKKELIALFSDILAVFQRARPKFDSIITLKCHILDDRVVPKCSLGSK